MGRQADEHHVLSVQRRPARVPPWNLQRDGAGTERRVHQTSNYPRLGRRSDSYTLKANVYVACRETRRIVAFNRDTKDFQMIRDGGIAPYDIEFLSEESFLYSNYQHADLMDTEGEVKSVLYETENSAAALLNLPHLNQVAYRQEPAG